MAVNLDKPHLWKADTQASVDYYNRWFLRFAPKAFRATRLKVTAEVEQAIAESDNFRSLSPGYLYSRPQVLRTLRMACCPPIAVDRLLGLASVGKSLVENMELGRLPVRMPQDQLSENVESILSVVRRLLDPDLFPWLQHEKQPAKEEVYRASTIVADRLTGADANPIIRNEQEKRQLAAIKAYLTKRGYREKRHPPGGSLHSMEPGTFTFHYGVPTGNESRTVSVSVDVMIQPHTLLKNGLPIFVEAKSAGDFTNTNKRRKEEAKKFSQFKATFGADVLYIVFLCGYFDAGYLGYEAQEGIDWVWEHRISDFEQFGI